MGMEQLTRFHLMTTVWIIFLLAFTMAGAGNVYHNQFAVQVKGGNEVADKIAERHGLENKGQIGNLNEHFLFESHKLEKRSAEPCPTTHSKLSSDPDVSWCEQQVEQTRVKRGGGDL